MQRTLYDAELPAGARKSSRDRKIAGVKRAHPGADVVLVTHKAKGEPTRYRVVASLPRPKGSKKR